MFIENDVFDIASRLKEIDATYRVRYSLRQQRFQLFGGTPPAYLLTFPFDKLDERAVIHARKTRRERLDQIMKEIEEENKKTEAAAMKDAKNSVNDALKEAADRVFYAGDR